MKTLLLLTFLGVTGCMAEINPAPDPESQGLVWKITNPCFPGTNAKLFYSFMDLTNESQNETVNWPTHYDLAGTYTVSTPCIIGDLMELEYSPTPYNKVGRIQVVCEKATIEPIIECKL